MEQDLVQEYITIDILPGFSFSKEDLALASSAKGAIMIEDFFSNPVVEETDEHIKETILLIRKDISIFSLEKAHLQGEVRETEAIIVQLEKEYTYETKRLGLLYGS